MKTIKCIILLCFIHSTSSWIRFRFPMSRRNYLQQTALEMLQNCGGNPEELCGVCGEGPNELPTELISTKDFQPVNISKGPLEIRLGFRRNMQGFFEIRLCKLGPDSLVNADYCRNVAPLKLYDDYRYIPGNEQNSARLAITLPPDVACERCVLQVKYIPGANSRVSDQLFFDCALLRIPRGQENLKLSGRIILSTDQPLKTTPLAPEFSTPPSVPTSRSPDVSFTTTRGPNRFSDMPITATSGKGSSTSPDLTSGEILTKSSVMTEFQTNRIFTIGQSSVMPEEPSPTLTNSGKFISMITNPLSTTPKQTFNNRFRSIGSSGGFRNVLDSRTGVTDLNTLRNRQFVGLEQLGPQTRPPSIEPRPSEPSITTVTDFNNFDSMKTIIINETSTSNLKSITIMPTNATVAYTNFTDVFGNNKTENMIFPENDTLIPEVSSPFITSTVGGFNDTGFLINMTEITNNQTEISLPDMTPTRSTNETDTVVIPQNTTDVPSRTVYSSYDMYDNNNTYPRYTDYYYDYFTYSDIPANKTAVSKTIDTTTSNTTTSSIDGVNTTFTADENATFIDTLNITMSTDYTFNDTYTINATTETQTKVDGVASENVTGISNTSETTEPYPFYYDYDIVTNASIKTDTFTEIVTESANATSLMNDSTTWIYQDVQTTTSLPVNNTELVIDVSTDILFNDTFQTTNVISGINDTMTEIPIDVPQSTINQTLESTSFGRSTSGIEQSQKIVTVSDTLFDRVLFPTPKPNQRVVEVPSVITILPTKDTVPSRTTTPGPFTTIPTINTEQSTYMTVTRTANVTSGVTDMIITEQQQIFTDKSSVLVNDTFVNQTDFIVEPYIETTTERVPITTTRLPTQPAIVTDPGMVTTEIQTDTPTTVTSGIVTYQTDITGNARSQSTTTVDQTIIDTTKFDINSTPFVSDPVTSTTYRTEPPMPVQESTTVTNKIQPIRVAEVPYDIPEASTKITPLFPGQTERNMGIDIILDRQTKPGSVRINKEDNGKQRIDPITQPRTTPVSTFGQFQGGITYMPDFDGQSDTVGGIPIKQGMFIDFYIPKFNPDTKEDILLQKVNSSDLLTDMLNDGSQRGATRREMRQNNNMGMRQNNNMVIGTDDIKTVGDFKPVVTRPTVSSTRRTSFGQFTELTPPASTNVKAEATRRRFNANNGMPTQGTFTNRMTNILENVDDVLNNRIANIQDRDTIINTIKTPIRTLPRITTRPTATNRRSGSRDLFFNLLDSPEVMPPIFVPKRSNKADKISIRQSDRDTDGRVVSSNTVWKGPGVGQGFGRVTGPITFTDSDRSSDGLRGASNFFGVTGPVYVPVDEVAIPLSSRDGLRKVANSAENPAYNEINTTFSTLWDLNRLNRNGSKESGTFSKIDSSTDQIMPPYIGIPLVWSSNTAGGQVEETTRPSEKNWNDLPVPDVMPPIKVRLLNITSKGTFVDNNAMLNKTDDVNKRILQKLETIVGELQRNRAILTQTLEVNPALEQSFQLSFDRFPGQLSRFTDSRSNQMGVQGRNPARINLLSEVVQNPVNVQRIGNVDTRGESSAGHKPGGSDNLVDPRGNAPISQATIGSAFGSHNFNLMNMLGISDIRPLTGGETGIRIRIDDSILNNDTVTTQNTPSNNQAVVDTGFMGNDTFTLLANTIKAFLTNQSVENGTSFDEFGTNNTRDEMFNGTNQDWYQETINATTPLFETLRTTEQTIVDIGNMTKMLRAITSGSNNLPKVTSNNQLVISPTVSELLNPFLGTNISLENRTESLDNNITFNKDAIIRNKTSIQNLTNIVSKTTTTSGQKVISGSENVELVKDLNKWKDYQKDLTDTERVRGKFVRLSFNNRVKGIKDPTHGLSIEGKYYVGQMQENGRGEFEPIPVNSGPILHEVDPTSKSATKEQPLVQLSEFNISPSMETRVEASSGRFEQRADAKRQIVPIQTLSSTGTDNSMVYLENSRINDGNTGMQSMGIDRSIASQENSRMNDINRGILSVGSDNSISALENGRISNRNQDMQPARIENSIVYLGNSRVNDVNRATKEKHREKAIPMITKQFFDQSDILNSRDAIDNSGGLQIKQASNRKLSGNFVIYDSKSTGDTTSDSAKRKIKSINIAERTSDGSNRKITNVNTIVTESDNSNRMVAAVKVNQDKIDPRNVDLFSGMYRQRLPNSRSLTPVAPSNMCPDGQLFVCKAIDEYMMVPGMKWWCFSHCRLGDCPEEKCRCTCETTKPYTIESRVNTVNNGKVKGKEVVGVNNLPTASISDGQNMFREKTIINLTLNGSETSKVALPIETQSRPNTVNSRTGKLVITKYDTSESQGSVRGSDVRPLQYTVSPVVRTADISAISGSDNIPPPDSMKIGLESSTTNILLTTGTLTCKGINAFADKPEIDRWCTLNCNRNVCPKELCVCM